MRQNKPLPKKHLQAEHQKEPGTGNTSANIFKLVHNVVKKQFNVSAPYDKAKDNLQFAEYCLSFLHAVHPEKLQELKFNVDEDNLATFTGCLVHNITELGYKLAYMNSDPSFPLQVLYSVPYESDWYLLQLKFINTIKSKALKIGYAYLLRSYDRACSVSVTEFSYADDEKWETTPMDHHYEDAIQYLGQEDMDADSYVRDFKKYKKQCFKTLQKYSKLLEQPISIFHNSRPRNEKDRKLKELITKGLTYDFSVFHKFADDDGYDDGGTIFSEFHKVIFDIDNSIEDQWTSETEDIANHNGYINPMGYYSVTPDVINQTTPDMIDALVEGSGFIHKINHFLREEYNSK